MFPPPRAWCSARVTTAGGLKRPTCTWIRRYIVFHKKKHPSAMRAGITAFLTWLAVDQRVSASTQNQALSAVLFLYREVLETDRVRIGAVRARHYSRAEVLKRPTRTGSRYIVFQGP